MHRLHAISSIWESLTSRSSSERHLGRLNSLWVYSLQPGTVAAAARSSCSLKLVLNDRWMCFVRSCSASGHALPKEFHALMTDPSSPIIDFYPENFDVDMDGCQQAWQGVALLPFIDERRLLDAIEPLENRLTGELLHRNSHGDARLLMHAAHRGAPASPTLDEAVPLDPAASGGLHGTVKLAPEAVPIGSRFPSPIKYLQPIPQNQVLVLKYFNPMRQVRRLR